MTDYLQVATLHRIGGPMKRERYTFDFVVNGVSLFEATRASDLDMCGCLSDPQFENELARRFNGSIVNTLTSDVLIGSGHRTALFVCSECGDLACGAITALVSRNTHGVQWSDFAYDNGYEAASPLDHLGPFEFDSAMYFAEIKRADTG